MIVIVVEDQYLPKIESALMSTKAEIEKMPYINLIVDGINPYKAEYDLLDFLWGSPTGHIIVLYGTMPQRFKEDYRVTKNNTIIDRPENWWVKAQQAYESINGPIQP